MSSNWNCRHWHSLDSRARLTGIKFCFLAVLFGLSPFSSPLSLLNKDDGSACFLRLTQGLVAIMYVKCLGEWLASGRTQ